MEQVKINPGTFKEVVTFFKRTETRTSTGAVKADYLIDGRAWAKVVTKPIVESIDNTICSDPTIEIICYQRVIDTSYIIERRGKRYDVISIQEIGYDYLSIIANELNNGAH